MGRPLDEIPLTVIRRPGAWTDGSWVSTVSLLTAPVDGDPTPASTATVDDVSIFVVGEYALFFDVAGAQLGIAEIVSINVPGKVITFVTDSLTWDSATGNRVAPAIVLLASTPQPTTPEAIDFLDEGARTDARFVIYAEDDQPELYLVGLNREDFAADVVYYNDDYHLVNSDSSWDGMPLGGHSYVLMAYGPDEAFAWA
jgi:hypothetical protein